MRMNAHQRETLALSELKKPEVLTRLDDPRYSDDFGELAALGLCTWAESIPAEQVSQFAEVIGANWRS